MTEPRFSVALLNMVHVIEESRDPQGRILREDVAHLLNVLRLAALNMAFLEERLGMQGQPDGTAAFVEMALDEKRTVVMHPAYEKRLLNNP